MASCLGSAGREAGGPDRVRRVWRRRDHGPPLIARLLASIALVAVIVALGPQSAACDEVTVPAGLQVQLLDRVLRYEHAFPSVQGPATVLVVVRPGGAESERVAAQLRAALVSSGTLAGRAVQLVVHQYRSAPRLGRRVRARGATVVYLSAGLGGAVGAIVPELPSPGVVLVSSVGGDVQRGATLAFELVSARPGIAVNLPQATAQQLQFSAHVLRVARVVR